MTGASTPPLPSPPPPIEPEPDLDVVAGDPPVPITVWRTAARPGDGPLPLRLAQRLIAAYTSPGDAVVDLTADQTLAAATVRAGRRHFPMQFAELDTAATPTAKTGDGGTSVTEAADTARTSMSTRDIDQRGAALVVVAWPLSRTTADVRSTLESLLSAATRLLHPDGCLILTVIATAAPEDFGPVVTAARTAGLGYLQHIVAVRAAVDGDQFTYYASAEEARALTRRTARTHRRAHQDLLVFTPLALGGAS